MFYWYYKQKLKATLWANRHNILFLHPLLETHFSALCYLKRLHTQFVELNQEDILT